MFWDFLLIKGQLSWILLIVFIEKAHSLTECKLTMFGTKYSGYTNITISGRICQRWELDSPHSHNFNYMVDQDNYCRNPDSEPQGPWCYTIDPNKRWEYCDIPFCESTTLISATPPTQTETTASVTNVPTQTFSKTCKCHCSQVSNTVYSSEEVEELISDLKKRLTIDTTVTSRYIRQRSCATDTRTSSQTMGTFGVAFLIGLAIFILLIDCLRLLRYCCNEKASF